MPRLPVVLEDPEQRASLDERVAAARALGAGDPRLGRSVAIPAGAFTRGSGPGEGSPLERPQRLVRLAAYEIDATPVTVAQFARFAERGYRDRGLWSDAGWSWREANGVERPRFWGEAEWQRFLGASQPVVGASWFEAEAYARFAGRRLPTEAEWERAARGDAGARRYPWGDAWRPENALHRATGVRQTLPVGCFPAGRSPFGLWDAAGNVWEWVADAFDEAAYSRAAGEGLRVEEGELRVARGGAWNALPAQLRCANRNAWPPAARHSNLGFRTAR